ncbi:DUF2184 domain-containing protein [Sandarakinorhabdus sp. DWP1-3-1]|uniref:DUF2184 domain-containing protein n=1 Tax=Sandarakinorhabdus sp. DWP1-3-1 TaxID=2804627 RepID=UPI003CF14AD1
MPEINFLDAQQALGFIVPQLLRIETEVYQVKYPSFDYSRLMFTNVDGDMWDVGSVFYSGDIAGKAEFLSGKGFDMPFADIAQTQFVRANQLAGIGYEWSLQELQRAARLGRNLGNDKAMAAAKVAEQFIYGIAIRGSAEKNMTGLINDAGVPAATVPADGTGATTTWSTKTPDQINRDINLALNAPFTATRETQIANTLLLPTTRMQYIASTRMGTNDNDTILKFIRENNFYKLSTGQELNIIASRELETAGAGSTARMVAYENAREVVQMHLPGPHEFLPAFQKSAMTWEVGGIMNVGGTEWRLPKGGAYYDGI